MKIRCYKRKTDGSGNDRVKTPKTADLISVTKTDHSKAQVEYIANHYGFKGDVRESDKGLSWNVWKIAFEDYAPEYEVDTDTLEGYPA